MLATLIAAGILSGGTTPPVSDYAKFKAVFPAFAAAPDATIDFWWAQAALIVDRRADCLGEGAELAQMLLVAHYLVLAGIGTGAEAQMAAQGMASFKSIKSGSLSLDRGESKSAGGQFATTSYGQRFWAMLLPCVSGPRVTGTGHLPGGLGGPFNRWGF